MKQIHLMYRMYSVENLSCLFSALKFTLSHDALISEWIIYGRHICVTWLLIRPTVCSFCGLLPPKLSCDHYLCYLFLAGSLKQSDLHVLTGIPDCEAESENTWEKKKKTATLIKCKEQNPLSLWNYTAHPISNGGEGGRKTTKFYIPGLVHTRVSVCTSDVWRFCMFPYSINLHSDLELSCEGQCRHYLLSVTAPFFPPCWGSCVELQDVIHSIFSVQQRNERRKEKRK